MLLLFLLNGGDQRVLESFFLNGFILGCIFNLIWSVIEGFSFYIFDVTLNNVLFVEFAKTLPQGRQYMTVVADGIIRASGFNYDPAHLGGIIPIVVFYAIFKKNLYLFILTLISLIFSGSTTALVSSLLILIVNLGKLHLFDFRIRKMKKINSGILLLCLIGSLIFISINGDIRESIYRNAEGFYNRTTETYIDDRDQSPRYIYHAFLPDAILYNGIRVLTGTGFGTASYPYVADPNISKILKIDYYPYDPESTYISYLFDVGFLGLSFYLFILIKSLLIYRRKMELNDSALIIYSSLCGIFFSGFFYHYTLTAYQILLLIFASLMINWDARIGLKTDVKSSNIARADL